MAGWLAGWFMSAAISIASQPPASSLVKYDLCRFGDDLKSTVAAARGWIASRWWSPLPDEFRDLIQNLDDDSFDVRQEATARLRQLTQDPDHAAVLAAHFERLLGDERTSAEVRWQLEALRRDMPAVPPPRLSPIEIDRLLVRLESDSYVVRAAASAQLERLAGNPATLCLMLDSIKSRLADPKFSLSSRLQIERLWQRTHGAWLLSDSAQWKLTRISPARIRSWIDDLAKQPPEDHEGPWLPHQTATRELFDLIVRPDTCSATTGELARRLVDPDLNTAARLRLATIYDWTRPKVAFELWSQGRKLFTQYYSIPNRRSSVGRSQDFDRVNDFALHCATDEILPEGDYVVGEAVSDGDPDYFWYSVNLPTAKRRLAYNFVLHNRVNAERLADITVETFQRRLDFQRPLCRDDFAMLDQLDSTTISRFAGRYLATVNDAAEMNHVELDNSPGDLQNDPTKYSSVFGSPSRHGKFCLWLADHGTRDAIAGLVRAAEGERVYKPDKDCPLDLPWIAALTIAQRDPWSGEDAWLAEQASRTKTLDLNSAADLGATAAAILLQRCGERPSDFGVEEVESNPLERLHFRAYRIRDPERRAAVLRWWSEKQANSTLSGR